MLALIVLVNGRRFRRTGDDDVPSCGCDCCDVVPRRPDEVAFGVTIQCAPSSKHDASLCPSQCRTDEDDQVLPTVQGDVVDYFRFCYFECKPAGGPMTPVDEQCTSLDQEDVEQLVDKKSGNPRDPAVLLLRRGPPPQMAPHGPSPPQASLLKMKTAAAGTITQRVSEDPAAVDPEAAKLQATQGMKQAAYEGHEARMTAKTVRQGQEERAERISNNLGAPNPYASVADIHAAMLESMKSAGAAGEAAQEAEAAVEEARAGDWSASIEEGTAAMSAVKGQSDAKDAANAAYLKKITNTAQIKAAEAAAKASEPYFLSMLRAQQTVKDYTAKAGANAGKAQALEKKAKGLEKKANEQNAAGDQATADKTIAYAKEVMAEAQNYAKQAKQMFAVAEEINKGIPKYQAAAQAAAARAAWASNPAWNPR